MVHLWRLFFSPPPFLPPHCCVYAGTTQTSGFPQIYPKSISARYIKYSSLCFERQSQQQQRRLTVQSNCYIIHVPAPRAARRLRPSAQSAVLFSPPSQEAILDIKRIRVSYLRTWFIPDVIAAFPIGYILLFAVIMNTTAAAADSHVVHSL